MKDEKTEKDNIIKTSPNRTVCSVHLRETVRIHMLAFTLFEYTRWRGIKKQQTQRFWEFTYFYTNNEIDYQIKGMTTHLFAWTLNTNQVNVFNCILFCLRGLPSSVTNLKISRQPLMQGASENPYLINFLRPVWMFWVTW